jgi:cytochrome c556
MQPADRDDKMRTTIVLLSAFLSCALASVTRAEDLRQLVRLPEPAREHMLANMRDHLSALSGIIGKIADGKFDDAANIAEQRLGMSSIDAHRDGHLASFLPKPMQDMGTTMHRAASRTVIVIQDASTDPSTDGMRKISRSLYEITTACDACHQHYRFR